MIATPLKHPGIHLSSEISSQRRNIPVDAVFFDNIPENTLTPVKDLVKYQKSSLKSNDCKRNTFAETTTSNKKNIFQSTMLTEPSISSSYLDISAIKPINSGLKNKAAYESPGKVFQRMKEKVLRDKQAQASRNCSILEPPNSENNTLFTPKKNEKRPLQRTFLCEEKENNRSFQSGNGLLMGYFYYVLAKEIECHKYLMHQTLSGFQNTAMDKIHQHLCLSEYSSHLGEF